MKYYINFTAMDQCNICKKKENQVEELCECANCEELVCESCGVSQGGGGPESPIWLCNDCTAELPKCHECLNYVPDDFMNLCPTCKSQICDDCFETHECLNSNE